MEFGISQDLKDAAEHVADYLPEAEIFYAANGTSALVVSQDVGGAGSYLVNVTPEGNTVSANGSEWVTGFDA